LETGQRSFSSENHALDLRATRLLSAVPKIIPRAKDLRFSPEKSTIGKVDSAQFFFGDFIIQHGVSPTS
jgi:hypothetical protein